MTSTVAASNLLPEHKTSVSQQTTRLLAGHVTTSSSTHVTYNTSMHGWDEFAMFYLNVSSSEARVYVTMNGSVVADSTGASSDASLAHAVLKPSRSGAVCRALAVEAGASDGRCAMDVVVLGVQAGASVPFTLLGVRGPILRFGEKQFGSVSRGSTLWYAFEAEAEDTPLGVNLQPDADSQGTDVDLFIYEESNPFRAVFPSAISGTNHGSNLREVAILYAATGSQIGLIFVGAHGATDSSVEENAYSVWVDRNIDEQQIVYSVALIVLGGVALLVVCTAVTRACFHDGRRRGVQPRQAWDRPAPTGLSPEQIQEVCVQSKFTPDSMPAEDAKCSVCLAEYEAGDGLLTLPCKHVYHEPCVAMWFETSRLCPLCKQDPVDVARGGAEAGGGAEAAAAAAAAPEEVELQSSVQS